MGTTPHKRTQRRVAYDEADAVALLHAVALFCAHQEGGSRRWQQVADAVVAERRASKSSRWTRDTFQSRHAEAQYKLLVRQYRHAVESNGMAAPLPQSEVLRELLETAVADEDRSSASSSARVIVDMTSDADESLQATGGGAGAVAFVIKEEEKSEDSPPHHGAILPPQATEPSTHWSNDALPFESSVAQHRPSIVTPRTVPPRNPRLPLVSLSLPAKPAIVMNPVRSILKRRWDTRLDATRRAVRRTVNLTPAATTTTTPAHEGLEDAAATVNAEPRTGDTSLGHLDPESAQNLLLVLNYVEAPVEPMEDAAIADQDDIDCGVELEVTEDPNLHAFHDDQSSTIEPPEEQPTSPPMGNPTDGTSGQLDFSPTNIPTFSSKTQASRALAPMDALPGDPEARDPSQSSGTAPTVSLTEFDVLKMQMLATMASMQRTQATLQQHVQTRTSEVAASTQAREQLQLQVETLHTSHNTLQHENAELRHKLEALQASRSSVRTDEKVALLQSRVDELRQSHDAMKQENAEQRITIALLMQMDPTQPQSFQSQIKELHQNHTAMVRNMASLEQHVGSLNDACAKLHTEGGRTTAGMGALKDRLDWALVDNTSWHQLVEELADHTKTLERTVKTHETILHTHTTTLETHGSAMGTLDATYAQVDLAVDQLREQLNVEVASRVALEAAVDADRIKRADDQQRLREEILDKVVREREQETRGRQQEKPDEEAKLKEEIGACREELARQTVLQDEAMKTLKKRVEDRHHAYTQQQIKVLRTIKLILETS